MYKVRRFCESHEYGGMSITHFACSSSCALRSSAFSFSLRRLSSCKAKETLFL